jgi:hypothetical protein
MPSGGPPSNFFVFSFTALSMKTTERVIHCSYKFLGILLQSGAEEMRRKFIETSVKNLINF